MPAFFSVASKALRTVDLFPTSKLIRYNGETEYNSTTGGLISAAVIAIFIILFASMGLRTLDRKIITSSTSTQYEDYPSPLNFVTNGNHSSAFMFAIFPWNFYTNPYPNRMFDLTLQLRFEQGDNNLLNSTSLTM